MPSKAKETTVKAEKYILKHADKNIYGANFRELVAQKTGASVATVRKLMKKHKIALINDKQNIIAEMFADGKAHDVTEVMKKTGYKNGTSVVEKVKQLGFQGQLLKGGGKYQRIDITKYAGKSQAELAEILGARVDAICRAAKMYGWNKYLVNKQNGHKE